MAGTAVGSVDHVAGDGVIGPPNLEQEQFKIVFDFFNTTMVGAGYAALHALQYGSGGTGTDFHDGANPFGENAFAVFQIKGTGSGNASASRSFDYYVLVQWAYNDAFGASPGNPGALQGGSGDGVGLTVAFREDGTSPWAGTTNADGTDTKGATVWTPGTSTLHVLDVADTSGGSYATNKENTLRLDDFGVFGEKHRIHCVGDADSFVLCVDHLNDATYDRIFYGGVYVPRPGLTISYSMVVMSSRNSYPIPEGISTTYGSAAGSSFNEGGMIGRLASEGVAGLSIGADMPLIFEAAIQPNNQPATNALDGIPIRLAYRGTSVGYAGTLDPGLLDAVFNVPTHDANAAQTRAYLGSATQASIHYSIPWDGATAPGSNNTRGGVQF